VAAQRRQETGTQRWQEARQASSYAATQRGEAVGRRARGAGGGLTGSRVPIFLGRQKQKEMCGVYVGWLAGIGVLAHFGVKSLPICVFFFAVASKKM
jgi:hypothetical protein